MQVPARTTFRLAHEPSQPEHALSFTGWWLMNQADLKSTAGTAALARANISQSVGTGAGPALSRFANIATRAGEEQFRALRAVCASRTLLPNHSFKPTCLRHAA